MFGIWGRNVEAVKEPETKVCMECSHVFVPDGYSDYCALKACVQQRTEKMDLERRKDAVVRYLSEHWKDFEEQVLPKIEEQRKFKLGSGGLASLYQSKGSLGSLGQFAAQEQHWRNGIDGWAGFRY